MTESSSGRVYDIAFGMPVGDSRLVVIGEKLDKEGVEGVFGVRLGRKSGTAALTSYKRLFCGGCDR